MTDADWWVIADDDFLNALRRAHAGEDPDLLHVEYHANSEASKDE